MRLVDGLQNLLSGMGGSRDKGAQSEYVQTVDNAQQLLTAYTESSIVRRAVRLPAEDSCREWREWKADKDVIEALEAEEARLGLQEKVLEARVIARLLGGAALYLGGGTDLSEPFVPGRDEVEFLTVFSRHHLTGDDIDMDPASTTFSHPRRWMVVAGSGGTQYIHPSRLVLFHGVKPLYNAVTVGIGDGWGRSVLPGMIDPIKRVEETSANINSLEYEAKIDIIKIPGLMHNLNTRGTAYEDELIRRMQLVAQSKGINGSVIMDSEEHWEQKTITFGGLSDVFTDQMQLASAAAGLPMTLLFEMSPGGMNSTGDSDVRNYYDRVKVEQTLSITPAMRLLDEAIIWRATGSRDPAIHYSWRPLWQVSQQERAEIGDKLASVAERIHAMEAMDTGDLLKALANALTEAGVFLGLEQAAENAQAPIGGGDLDL